MNKNLFAPTGFRTDDIDVKVSELLVATADRSDAELDRSIGEVLKLLRERMGMDVVFVSEFTQGRRVMRKVEQGPSVQVIAEGDSAPLEQSWCQRVVDGRLPEVIPDASKDPAAAALLPAVPFPIGTHLSTPLVLANGDVYGTLCCFSLQPKGQVGFEDAARLKLTARLMAQRLESRRPSQTGTAKMPQQVPEWQLKPK